MQTTTRKGLPLPAANDQGSTSTTTGRGTSTSGVVRDSVNTISTIADYFTDYDKDEIIQGRWEFSSPFVTDKGLGQLFANNTGAARVVGDVVMLDPANDSTVILPNAVGVSAAKVGVVAENIANGAVGRVAWSGFIRVKVAGGFLRGQYLQTQNASVIAAGSTYASPGTFAIAMTAPDVNNTVLAALHHASANLEGGGTVNGQLTVTSNLIVGSGSANYVQIAGATTGNYPIISAVGSDVNIALALQSKGTGTVALQPGGVNALLVSNVTSAVNYLNVNNSISGVAPNFVPVGTDTNIGILFQTKGTAGYTFAGVLAANQVASQVNYWVMTSSATGVNPTLAVAGTDANVSMTLSPKGTGVVEQRNGTNAQTLRIYNTYTDASNYERLILRGNVSEFDIFSDSAGTGTARPLVIGTFGNANVNFWTNSVARWGITSLGQFIALTDNAFDIGASGANRPRNIFQSGGTFQSANPGSGIANDNTNYERLHVEWNSNAGYLWTTQGGTGLARSLLLGTQGAGNVSLITNNTERWRVNTNGHLLAPADNTLDIGASGVNRPRNLYVAGQITAGSAPANVYFNFDASAAASSYSIAGQFQKVRDATNIHYWIFTDVGGLSTDGAGGSMWRGVQFAPPTYTVASSNVFARLSFYANLNTLTDPTVRQWVIMGQNDTATNAQMDLVFGTGATQRWYLGGADGHLRASTDNAYDIGQSGANRPRNIYQVGGTFHSYNNGITNDGTNYERLNYQWSSNLAVIQTEAGGTGVARVLAIGTGVNAALNFRTWGVDKWQLAASGHLLALTDNTYDIGQSSSTRPRNIYQSGGVFQSYNPGSGIANDGTNYERLSLFWGSNFGQVLTEQAGTGVARSLTVGTTGAAPLYLNVGGITRWQVTTAGHLFAQTDNTYDIGSSGGVSRPRNLYVAGQAQLGSGSANYLQLAGAATGNTPSVLAQGSDTNVTLALQSKGTGWVSLQPGANQTALAAVPATNAVNYITVTGAATGNFPIISAVGSDTNIHLGLVSKGTGAVALQPAGVTAMLVNNVASAVNYTIVTNAGTGGNPTISVGGTDTNINLGLLPKGTGVIVLGGGMQFTPDNTYDIGASGSNRPRNVYVAGTLTATTLVGTLSTAAQANITSLGTLASGPYTNDWFRNQLTSTGWLNQVQGIGLYITDAVAPKFYGGSYGGTYLVSDTGTQTLTNKTLTNPKQQAGSGYITTGGDLTNYMFDYGTTTATLPNPSATYTGVFRTAKAWGGTLTVNCAVAQIAAPGGTGMVSSFTLNNGDSATMWCDGTYWWVL